MFKLKTGTQCRYVVFPYGPIAGLGERKQNRIFYKLRTRMIFHNQHEFGIDTVASILIGDKLSDIEAGIAAGVGRNLLLHVEGGYVIPSA